jgi:hypothetical protein
MKKVSIKSKAAKGKAARGKASNDYENPFSSIIEQPGKIYSIWEHWEKSSYQVNGYNLEIIKKHIVPIPANELSKEDKDVFIEDKLLIAIETDLQGLTIKPISPLIADYMSIMATDYMIIDEWFSKIYLEQHLGDIGHGYSLGIERTSLIIFNWGYWVKQMKFEKLIDVNSEEFRYNLLPLVAIDLQNNYNDPGNIVFSLIVKIFSDKIAAIELIESIKAAEKNYQDYQITMRKYLQKEIRKMFIPGIEIDRIVLHILFECNIDTLLIVVKRLSGYYNYYKENHSNDYEALIENISKG